MNVADDNKKVRQTEIQSIQRTEFFKKLYDEVFDLKFSYLMVKPM